MFPFTLFYSKHGKSYSESCMYLLMCELVEVCKTPSVNFQEPEQFICLNLEFTAFKLLLLNPLFTTRLIMNYKICIEANSPKSAEHKAYRRKGRVHEKTMETKQFKMIIQKKKNEIHASTTIITNFTQLSRISFDNFYQSKIFTKTAESLIFERKRECPH